MIIHIKLFYKLIGKGLPGKLIKLSYWLVW